ncbi:alpha-mannosidase [Anaerohalosphaera lusitana]|uniref:Alpha-mannosidase n=1 Tax=Anaerohalosphaera lusitana TaxID=1936003 RepID=A0A1U9NLI1_9BACT|nr:polysaccharide lyase family protein [Anaerohalosphaera lusitana]AQT68769.1 alpha-mannosidase [Anaerohalosphaera lusitana]
MVGFLIIGFAGLVHADEFNVVQVKWDASATASSIYGPGYAAENAIKGKWLARDVGVQIVFCLVNGDFMKMAEVNLKKIAVLVYVLYFQSLVSGQAVTLWQIGTPDNDYSELAIARNYSAYSSTFPYDADYMISTDSPGTDWPYIQPSTSDSWAESKQHPFLIRFDTDASYSYPVYQLDICLVASHCANPPSIDLSVNGQSWQFQTTVGPGDQVLTDPSVGDFQTYTAYIQADDLQASGNLIKITTTGSWMLYDAVVLQGLDSVPALKDFEIDPQPFWYHYSDGVSRSLRIDFVDAILAEPAQVEIVTPEATFTRNVNAEANVIGSVDVLVPMPDSNSENPVPVTIRLHTSRGDVEKTASIAPERQWKVHLVHQTHLDIGYTHTQPEVMNVQVDHLYKALDYIDDSESEGRPKDELFKWHPEGMWAVEEFLKNRASETDKQRFFEAVKDGTMHMDAMYAQAMTGIYSEEELFELMAAAKRFEKEAGIEITSAMQTDVPGYTWGLTSALAHWGVKYMSVGPNSGHRLGHTFTWGDRPFYWVSPSGKHRILFWMAGKGYGWFHGNPTGHCITSEEGKILAYLSDLEMQGYPYDMVNIRYAIGADNGPPNPALTECVAQWNTKYAFPKLILSKNSEMMAEFEARYADQIPVRQKDFTPYWEDGCASTAADTKINRRAGEKLVQAQTLWSMFGSGDFPHEDFDLAWNKMIMYDEHTWGAHNSISAPDSDFAIQQAEYKQQFALDAQKFTDQLMDRAVDHIRKSGTNTVQVFNTLNWPRTELVLVSAEDSAAGNMVKDGAGAAVPSQRLSTGELAFIATDVPGLGSKIYTVHPGSSSGTGSAGVSGNTITNGIITAEFDTNNGAITSLTRQGISADLVDTSIGEGINDYLYILGRDAARGHKRIAGPVTMTVLDEGPLVSTVRLHSDAPGCRYLNRVVRLVDGADQIFISNTVDKLKERNPESVSFGFAFNVPEGDMKIDLQWAIMQPEVDQIEGANKNFFPTRRWVDISNDAYGVTWSSLDAPMVQFNPIKFGSGWHGSAAYRTYIEPGQAFHSWVMNNHWETNYKADQKGVMTFRYAIAPHVGGYDPVQAEHFGRSLHQPLIAVPVDPSQKANDPKINVQGKGVVVSTVEPSRDGTALMVRLFNSNPDAAVETTVAWPGGGEGSAIWLSSPYEDTKSEITNSFSMDPLEIVTLRLQECTVTRLWPSKRMRRLNLKKPYTNCLAKKNIFLLYAVISLA